MAELGSPPSGEASSSSLPMKRVVLLFAWAKTAFALLIAVFLTATAGGQDPAGKGMLLGAVTFAFLYWTVFVLPALWLGHRGRKLGVCLLLLLLPDGALALAALFL